MANENSGVHRSAALAALLSVREGAKAIDFYKAAFGATEVSRIEDPAGAVVACLSIRGAEFWLADEAVEYGNFSPASLGGSTVRLVLTVDDPDEVFAAAIAAGAAEVSPVVDQPYGWRIGRLTDPFGHSWEIGKPLSRSAAD
jgi:PhnB protein